MARKKPNSDARTIDLRSGGSVTLKLDYSAFDLTDSDRDFVNGLVQMFQSYDAKARTNASPAATADAKKKAKARRSRGAPSEDAEDATVAN